MTISTRWFFSPFTTTSTWCKVGNLMFPFYKKIRVSCRKIKATLNKQRKLLPLWSYQGFYKMTFASTIAPSRTFCPRQNKILLPTSRIATFLHYIAIYRPNCVIFRGDRGALLKQRNSFHASITRTTNRFLDRW